MRRPPWRLEGASARDLSRPEAGVFSTRAPSRPIRLACIAYASSALMAYALQVSGLEAIDGTPIVDLKPVLGSIDER